MDVKKMLTKLKFDEKLRNLMISPGKFQESDILPILGKAFKKWEGTSTQFLVLVRLSIPVRE